MQASAAVRLGTQSTCMCHCAVACVNSASTPAPFGNRHTPSGARSGAARASNLCNGARARAVIEPCRRQGGGFDADRVDDDRGAGDTGSLPQESGLALVCLDQVKRDAGGESENQAGKSGARAQIDRAFGSGMHQGNELQRIGDVTIPKDGFVPCRDEVHCPVPAQQQSGVAFESFRCLT